MKPQICSFFILQCKMQFLIKQHVICMLGCCWTPFVVRVKFIFVPYFSQSFFSFVFSCVVCSHFAYFFIFFKRIVSQGLQGSACHKDIPLVVVVFSCVVVGGDCCCCCCCCSCYCSYDFVAMYSNNNNNNG